MENISINSRRILQNQYGNMEGSTRKYVDRKCQLYSMKFVFIYIYIYIYIKKERDREIHLLNVD